MKKLFSFLGWSIGIILMIVGMVQIFGKEHNLLAGIGFLVMGGILIPGIGGQLYKRMTFGKAITIRIIVFVLTLILVAKLLPNSNHSTNHQSNQPSQNSSPGLSDLKITINEFTSDFSSLQVREKEVISETGVHRYSSNSINKGFEISADAKESGVLVRAEYSLVLDIKNGKEIDIKPNYIDLIKNSIIKIDKSASGTFDIGLEDVKKRVQKNGIKHNMIDVTTETSNGNKLIIMLFLKKSQMYICLEHKNLNDELIKIVNENDKKNK